MVDFVKLQEDVSVGDIVATAAATFFIGMIQIHKYAGNFRVKEVLVEQRTAGAGVAEWNIEVDGNDLFASEQTVTASNTIERFYPDQNNVLTGNTVDAELDISVSGSAGTINVGLLIERV